jgi:hypothetical protein
MVFDVHFVYNIMRGLAPTYKLGPREINVGPTNCGAK